MAGNIEIDESDDDGNQSHLQSLREELAIEVKKKKAEEIYKQLKDSVTCALDDITTDFVLTQPTTKKQLCNVFNTLQQRANTHTAHINQINYEKGKILLLLKDKCKDYIKLLKAKVIGFDYSKSYCEFLIRFHKTCLLFERLKFSTRPSGWIKNNMKIIVPCLQADPDTQFWRL